MPAACSCSQTVAEQRPQTLIAEKSCRGTSPDGGDEGRLCATGEGSESGSEGELGIYSKTPALIFLIWEYFRRIYFLKSTILINYGQLEPKWRTEGLEID